MLARAASFAILLTSSPFSLHAQDGTASLTGVLQYRDGAALVGVYVVLESAAGAAYQTTTDEKGGYRLSGLPAGSYTVTVRAAVYTVKMKVDLLADEQRLLPPVRFALAVAGDCFPIEAEPERSRFPSAGPSLGGLAGNVKSEQGPIAGARVWLECRFGQCKEDSKSDTTDSGGNFEFVNLRPGGYNLNVQQSGFFPLNMRFNIAGGLDSSYSLKLTPCPKGDCTVKPDPYVKPVVCE